MRTIAILANFLAIAANAAFLAAGAAPKPILSAFAIVLSSAFLSILAYVHGREAGK